MRSRLLIGTVVLLAACSQTDAPSEEVAEAAKQAVQVVEGDKATPRLADGPYAPRDDCGKLEGAEDFLADLRSAIEQRDEDALLSLAAEDVKLDFGGGSGTAELRRRLADPEDELWSELAPLPDLGCAANSQGGLTVPWYFEQQIPVDEPGNGFIVTGEGVPVYDEPGSGAVPIARLNWDAVQLVRDGPEFAGFRHVEVIPAAETTATPAPGPREDPLSGYVAEDKLRSMLDYRLVAASRNKRWRIISIVSGD